MPTMPTTLSQETQNRFYCKKVGGQNSSASSIPEQLVWRDKKDSCKGKQRSTQTSLWTRQKQTASSLSEDQRLQNITTSKNANTMSAWQQGRSTMHTYDQDQMSDSLTGTEMDMMPQNHHWCNNSNEHPSNRVEDNNIDHQEFLSQSSSQIVYRCHNSNTSNSTRDTSSMFVTLPTSLSSHDVDNKSHEWRRKRLYAEFDRTPTPSSVQQRRFRQNWQKTRSTSFNLNANPVTSQCMDDEELARFRTQICPKKVSGECLLEERCSYSHCLSFHR